ncbi:MAG: cytochrome ubiquinol oxidase subunit I [Akkermansia sp.]
METIDTSLIDWSRAQFALTAMYHWIFVPLTLGLGVIMAIMESIYLKTGKAFWKQTTQFWMKLFGINFAMGVATGLILEFQFGTNWSNYSWFVGDIFGAPLAIEGIVAFFLEATFVAVMYFGWNKVSKRAHLTATWMTVIGASLSALWILVANAWMQYPVGMHFNPDTVRNEMGDFWAVAFSPVAVVKYFHTVVTSWIVGAVFVLGVASWYLLKKRHTEFAMASVKIAAIVGLAASVISCFTGHASAENVAQYQPMKLAAMEGLHDGSAPAGLVVAGLLTPNTDWSVATEEAFLFKIEFPYVLSILANRDLDSFVPGINDILAGGYATPDGIALSADEMRARGRIAIDALADYRLAKQAGDASTMNFALTQFEENFKYFGYGYIKDNKELVPPVPLLFYSFRVMVGIASFLLAFFALVLFLGKRYEGMRLLQWVAILSVPLAYICSQSGWIVAEVGRQPWAIQGILPNSAAVSALSTSSVQMTFFIFLLLFTVLLVAELSIMKRAISDGPEQH